MAWTAIAANEPVARGATIHGNEEPQFDLVAGESIPAHRLVSVASDGDVEVAAAGDLTIIGANASEVAYVAGNVMSVAWGKCVVEAGGIISPGDAIKADDNGRAVRFVTSAVAGDEIDTTAVGSAFTNQPNNDGVEVLSANAGDTTQTVTIIGTTTGTDTVVVETVTLNGTTPVPTVKTDWGVVLAVKKSAATLGTVTVREASADQTITAGLTAAVLAVGVTEVPAADQQAYNRIPDILADGATTKQIGLKGTNAAGTVIYDSQALAGATVTPVNTAFNLVTEIYRGDLEVARTATVRVSSTVDNPAIAAGKALSAATASGQLIGALVLPV